MQYLIYPMKVMKISQNYNGTTSHYAESHGTPKAYPIDEAGADGGRDWFYAPCDLVIKRIYGVGNKGANTIWMESADKVKLANGKESYVTIRVTHPEDDDLSRLKVGQRKKQKESIFREGGDGGGNIRYGNHAHIEVNACKFSELTNNGWTKNSKGAWVTSPNSIKPEEAFWVDKSFTTIKSSNGLNFKSIDLSIKKNNNNTSSTNIKTKFAIGDKVIINGKLYSSSNATAAVKSVTNVVTNITRIAVGAKHPYNTTGDRGWMDESSIKKYNTSNGNEIKVGDKVKIVGAGSVNMNGGKTAYGLGWERKVLKIWAGKAYPYQLGDNSGTTGYYKANAIKKV